ncbi:MAG: metallophosphoesterase family protein [Anaerolineae bacterium]|nr:metallophosphoesterase family protein [Anaerolineae bacterium]
MRCLIVSDIHGNLAAFDAVLEAAQGYDQVWCLGDIVGYGPDPHECIQRLQSLPFVAVAGNHDWAVANRLDLDEFNADAQQAAMWTYEQLSPAERDFLAQLPERLVIGQFTLVHGSPRYPVWEYILQPSVARANFTHFDTPYCLVGHTHVPLIFALTEDGSRCRTYAPRPDGPLALADAPRMIINPGSVGQPRDGIPLAAYAILDTDALTLAFHRQPYPIEETQRKMDERALPRRLSARLSFGW